MSIYPTYTFQVNLQNPGLFPSRYQNDQDRAYDENNAMSDTRSVGVPGVGTFKHGEKFTVCGLLAVQTLKLMNAGDIPVVTCSADEDANCVPDTNEGTPVEVISSTATGTATMLPVSTVVVVAPGAGYSVANELTVVGGTSTEAAVINVDSIKTVLSQGATEYSPGEGTGSFVGGSGHVVSNIITMSDGTTVRVDAVLTGAVTEFTVTGISSSPHAADGDIITQSGTTGIGIGFSMTLGNVNQGVFTASKKLVAEVTIGRYSVLPVDPVSATGNSFSPGGATFNLDWGVYSVAVTDGGSGYTSVPEIAAPDSGGGEEAGLVSILTDGVVTSVTVQTPGDGYVATAVLTFDDPE